MYVLRNGNYAHCGVIFYANALPLRKIFYIMKLVTLVRKTLPYIKPYSWKIAATMVLTVIGAFIAQINAIVLDGTVDAISNHVIGESISWHRIAVILGIISAVLLVKEVLWSLITYHQHYFGMKIRIDVSRDLSQAAVDHLLRFRKSYFLNPNNETGKIQYPLW